MAPRKGKKQPVLRPTVRTKTETPADRRNLANRLAGWPTPRPVKG